MRTSGMRSTEIYEPQQWPVARVGQEPIPEKDTYKETLEFIESRLRRSKSGYVVEMDDGTRVGISKFLASGDFWSRWDLTTPEKLEKGMKEIRLIIDRFVPKDPRATQSTDRPTLFDADFMEQPYDTSVAPTPIAEAEHGAFVTLGERALAISEVMGAFSAVNSADHVRKEAKKDDSEFRRNYKGKAQVVAKGMGRSAARLSGKISEHLDTLTDVKGMRDAGFSKEEIKDVRQELKEELYERFSAKGPEVVKKRHQAVAKVNKTAAIARIAQRKAKS